MNKPFASLLGALLGVAACVIAVAAEPAAKPADPRAAIAKKFPGVKAEDIRLSPTGLYEVPLGGETGYVTADGRYIIAGDLFDVDSRVNLTEANRSAGRVKALAKLDERDMIVFSPQVVKHTITVFTDVECGYCRKLHGEIDQLNALGVRVRYAAYPRSGPGTEDWRKMEAVWCAKDRKSAITQAKLGQDVKGKACGTAPVAKQYAIGDEMGVGGTPAIFTNAGTHIGGYLPPEEMLRRLEQEQADKKGSTGS